jgi:hypothetical protein
MDRFSAFMNFPLDGFVAMHTPLLRYRPIHVTLRNSTVFRVVLNKLSVTIFCTAEGRFQARKYRHKFFVMFRRQAAKPRSWGHKG